MPGTPSPIIMMQTLITDPMKVMETSNSILKSTKEPEGEAEGKEVEEPLVLKGNREERTLHTTGTGFMHRTTNMIIFSTKGSYLLMSYLGKKDRCPKRH